MTRQGRNLALATRTAALACLGLLVIATVAWSQSIERGSIVGTAVDEQDARLPGVTVVLSSEALGTRSEAQTDEQGIFRFQSIIPGTYTLEASLEGFATARQSDIVLTVAKTLTVHFAMQLGSFTEIIEVAGAPLIDVQDSQLATMEIPNAVLMDVPNARDIRSLVSFAQGVHSIDPDGGSFSAYGSSEQGIQYSVDGVIINSPEAGETELEMDFDGLDDVSILGLGAPAEFDGFSGVIVNAVTKSGTNELHGLFNLYFEDSDWTSSNTDDPDLERGGAKRTSYNAHVSLGGPITRDKLFFFTSFRYLDEESPADPGFASDPTFTAPRLMGKINWLPSQEQSLVAFLEYSNHEDKFVGADDSAFFTPGTTFDNEQTQWAWNFNYVNVLTDSTILEAKFGGYVQEQDEIPESGDIPARYDEFEDMLYDNWFGPFVADRERYLLTTSVSHFTDNFKGTHDFKFGAEFERTPVHTLAGYSGGKYYISYDGEPYLRYDSDGYSTFAETDRFSLYAQDSWAVNARMRINAGLRMNYWRGSVEADRNGERVDLGTIFKPNLGWAPRIGITYSLPTERTSVIKAHWGRYYHQVISLYYSRLAPESDLSVFIWDEEEEDWVHEFTEIRDASQFTLDDSLDMPYMDAFVVGFEKEINRLITVDITGTYRTNHDFLDKVNLTGEFEELPYTDEFTGKTFNVYNQLNPGENQFLLTNPGVCTDYGQAFKPITCFEKERKYWGVTASMNKRWANKWQLQSSYTYGKATGNDDNLLLEFGEGRSSSLGGSDFYTNPNSQINATGRLSIDPTHLVKVLGSAELPWKILVGGFFRYFTGNTYNQIIPVFDVDPPDVNIYGETAGSFRQESGLNLDLRAEKMFGFGGGRSVGVGIDVFNVTNESTGIDSEQSVDSERPFGTTTQIVRPRRYRVGVRIRY